MASLQSIVNAGRNRLLEKERDATRCESDVLPTPPKPQPRPPPRLFVDSSLAATQEETHGKSVSPTWHFESNKPEGGSVETPNGCCGDTGGECTSVLPPRPYCDADLKLRLKALEATQAKERMERIALTHTLQGVKDQLAGLEARVMERIETTVRARCAENLAQMVRQAPHSTKEVKHIDPILEEDEQRLADVERRFAALGVGPGTRQEQQVTERITNLEGIVNILSDLVAKSASRSSVDELREKLQDVTQNQVVEVQTKLDILAADLDASRLRADCPSVGGGRMIYPGSAAITPGGVGVPGDRKYPETPIVFGPSAMVSRTRSPNVERVAMIMRRDSVPATPVARSASAMFYHPMRTSSALLPSAQPKEVHTVTDNLLGSVNPQATRLVSCIGLRQSASPPPLGPRACARQTTMPPVVVMANKGAPARTAQSPVVVAQGRSSIPTPQQSTDRSPLMIMRTATSASASATAPHWAWGAARAGISPSPPLTHRAS